MSKTESVLNVIGACLDDDPAPILYVGPTRSNVEKVIEPRMMAMFRSSPGLRDNFGKGKSSSKTAKRVNEVLCRLAWAGSASELASQEAQVAVMDEIDRMAFDVKGEGSPIELVDARLATYPNSKLILTSTPTAGNVNERHNDKTKLTHWELADASDITSTVWRLWQEGTRFEWAWPCPECREYFIPRLSLLRWPENCTPIVARRKAYIECPNCSAHLNDRFKTAMNEKGVFVAPGQSIDEEGHVSPEMDFGDHYSYWVSGLCSPWKSWGQRAAEYVTVLSSMDPMRIQGVVNTSFGELYRTGGEAPAWTEIKKLGAGYAFGEFPLGPLTLTCGVDVQKDRLVFVIRGWSYGLESWLVDYGELYGNTDEEDVWVSLGLLLQREWGGLPIRIMAIDSGYRPGDKFKRPDHMVYTFCRKWPGRAAPTKGHDTQSKPLHAALIDVKQNGQTIKRGVQLWHLDSDYFKSWVYARLRLPTDQPYGWHLPVDISDDYCQQITAEAKLIKASGAAEWIRLRRENHILDCEALNVAAAHMLSLQTLRPRPQPPKDEGSTTTEGVIPVPPSAPQQPRAQPQFSRPSMSGNWINGWRR